MLKNKYISIGIGVVIIIIALVFIINDFYKEDVIPDNTKEITKDGLSATLSEGSGNAEIEQIPIVDIDSGIDIRKVDGPIGQDLDYPELDREFVFLDSFPEEARVIINNNITTLKANLEVDKDSFGDWLDLAMQYKIIEDYEGARDIWEFLNIAFPGNSISPNNLGDLYHYYLKDFPKSEQNFKKAIENSPNAQSYIGLHELYKYSYKQETSMVTDILIEGIEKNPRNTDVIITLAAYYKEIGDSTNTKKYYEQAHDEAEKIGNIQLVELLNEEISKL